MKNKTILAVVFYAAVSVVWAEDVFSTLTLKLSPGVQVPVVESADQYTMGGFTSLTTAYKPPVAFPISLHTLLAYDYLPFSSDRVDHLNIALAGGGLGLKKRFLGRLSGEVFFEGGYFYGFLEDDEGNTIGGGNPFWDVGGELGFYLNPNLSLGIGGFYRAYTGNSGDMANTVGIYLGSSYRFPLSGDMSMGTATSLPLRPALLKISAVNKEGIFPVFYQYYDEHPIGSVTVKNGEKASIEDLRISVFIKGYMDTPKVHTVSGSIGKGETREIDMYALFNNSVLDITEGTKVAAEIGLEYTVKGETKSSSRTETFRLENRNASVWDDDRRAAAFVTARDPLVLRFSKNIVSLLRETEMQSVDGHLRVAVALHTALSRHGMTYVVDPKTPYEQFVNDKMAVDFLQFPRQSLEYRAGDCDDLTILYSSLLEALSIDTAFITVPGHIYLAFLLEMTEREARSFFSSTDDLIFRDDGVWLPLEITLVGRSFSEAWSTGAAQWRRYEAAGEAGFYPVKSAWEVFEPVGLPGNPPEISLPENQALVRAYSTELTALLGGEMQSQEQALLARIDAGGGSPRLFNKLGILYARYGFTDRAKEQFLKASDRSDYVPALVNLGNVSFLEDNLNSAFDYYSRADRVEPGTPTVLLGLARVYHAQEEYPAAEQRYEQLQAASPELAEKFAYLNAAPEAGARASTAANKEVMEWEE